MARVCSLAAAGGWSCIVRTLHSWDAVPAERGIRRKYGLYIELFRPSDYPLISQKRRSGQVFFVVHDDDVCGMGKIEKRARLLVEKGRLRGGFVLEKSGIALEAGMLGLQRAKLFSQDFD